MEENTSPKEEFEKVDTEPAKFIWTSIVSAIKGRMLGDGAPLWTFEAVPPARVGADKI